MADTVNHTETVAPEPLSNDGNPSATPVVNVDAAEVERLKKEADQAKMEAAQARNEAAKMKAEQESIKAKQLEENEEFKTLYEQSQAKLKEIEAEQAARERAAELKGQTEKVYAEYPSNVVELARTAGLTLSDDSDEAVSALKEKLDTFKAKVGAPTPSANNPRPEANNPSTNEQLLQRMRGGDKTATYEYIQNLPSIKRMKEIAQNGA